MKGGGRHMPTFSTVSTDIPPIRLSALQYKNMGVYNTVMRVLYTQDKYSTP